MDLYISELMYLINMYSRTLFEFVDLINNILMEISGHHSYYFGHSTLVKSMQILVTKNLNLEYQFKLSVTKINQ